LGLSACYIPIDRQLDAFIFNGPFVPSGIVWRDVLENGKETGWWSGESTACSEKEGCEDVCELHFQDWNAFGRQILWSGLDYQVLRMYGCALGVVGRQRR
jgi:hypothetical protein